VESGDAKWYDTAMRIGSSGSVMANRYNYLDLDPDLPQRVRPAADAHDVRLQGERAQDRPPRRAGHQRHREVDEADASQPGGRAHTPWTVVPYQSTHNTGGAIMGTSPRTSAVNKYLQSWDLPQPLRRRRERLSAQLGLQPDGAGGALAYWTADAIKKRYVKNPGPMVSA
jgi:gluconate 2-dehydrogenase alpha chain